MEITGTGSVRRLALSLLAWTVLALYFFSQSLAQKLYFHDPTPWWHSLVSWFAGMYFWALLTPLILWLGRRFPIERRNWPLRTASQLMFSIALSMLVVVLDSAFLPRLGILPGMLGQTFGSAFRVLTVIGFHGGVLTYWTVLGIQYGFRYYRRYQEREQQALRLELRASELQSQLMGAQLAALKMQLQPHFLFNTLNAIMVLVRQQKSREAEAMLALLSDLLRCVLEDVEAQEVPLRRELEYLQLYLSIEQVRFQDRLRVEITADPSILDAAVPQMCLQPLAENAVRHGIGQSSAASAIRITASRVNGTLEVKVKDDGPGFRGESSSHRPGIGLANTRARLGQLYGKNASLAVENGKDGGAVVTMVVPYHRAPAISEKEVLEVHGPDRADR